MNTKVNGTARIKRSAMKSFTFPNKTNDEKATTSIQGGALELDPIPIGCQESIYFLNKSKVLSGAVDNAPPARDPKRFLEATIVKINIKNVNG